MKDNQLFMSRKLNLHQKVKGKYKKALLSSMLVKIVKKDKKQLCI